MEPLGYLFVTIAGFAVGYLITYRDRGQEKASQQKLRDDNRELRRSIQTSQIAFDSLDEKFSRQRGQLNVLQQLCDDWSASRETSERERAQMESDLAIKASRISEVENEYRDEKRKRIELEDKVHKLAEEKLAERSSIEEEWRTKHSQTESTLKKTTVDLDSLKSDKTSLSKRLHDATAKIAELKSEIESSKCLIETATTNATGLKQEYVSLESALKANTNQLKRAEAECAKAISEKESALKSAAESDKKLAVQERETQSVREQHQLIQSQLETIRSQFEANQQQLAKVTQQRDQAMDSEKATGVVVTGLQKRLDNQESTIHQLRQNQDDALENLKHELKVRTEIESKFEGRVQSVQNDAERMRAEYESQIEEIREEVKAEYEGKLCSLKEQLNRQSSQYAEHSKDLRNQLSQQRDELEHERQRLSTESEAIASRFTMTKSELKFKITKLESEAATYTESIVKLDAQREQLKQELEASRQQTRSQLKQDSETIGNLQRERDDLRTELDQLHAKIAPLQEQIDSHRAFQTELDLTRSRATDMERQLAQRNQEAKRLQAQANELQRLRQRYQDAQERQDQLQIQLDQMVSKQIARESERTELQTLIRELEAKLKVSEDTIADLRKERAMVLATLADQRQSQSPNETVIAFTQSMDKAAPETHDYDNEYGGRMRRDANRGLVFTETPSTCDDLKRISGIAEVLEKRLNDFGIYTFKQVMEWQPVEIEEFSRLLAFRDRIVRDDWQGQARFFYNQKRKSMQAVA